MAGQTTAFWRGVADLRAHIKAGARDKAQAALNAICAVDADADAAQAESRRSLLRRLAETYGLTLQQTPPLVAESYVPPMTQSFEPNGRALSRLGQITPGGDPGISLVTCAMNRTENLLKALPSWLAQSMITEIVIVDWTSKEPVGPALAAAGIADDRIRLVRIEDERRWILSFAFNVGFRVARSAQILKADADIVLGPDFFEHNQLKQGTFIAGDWRKAATGQAFINGFFFVHKADLAEVAGFNEHITTYGWDDDDIYARLIDAGVVRCDVDPATIRHLDHSDEARVGEKIDAAQTVREEITSTTIYRIRRNRFIAHTMPYWNKRETLVPFDILSKSAREIHLRRQPWLPSPVPDHVERDADFYALSEIASWRLGVATRQLDREELDALLSQPFTTIEPPAATGLSAPSAPAVAVSRPRLYIDTQHGLGNRLRAIGSAAAVAEATGRELIIVWEPDHHCGGRLTDLYEYKGPLIETAFIEAALAKGCKVYNYMEIEEGAEKDAPLDLKWTGDIYVRSAYVLNAKPSNWAAENHFLRNLTPVEAVRDLVASVRTPNDLSAHVRMVGSPGTDTASYDRAENWTEEGHAQIHHWRKKSHYSSFIKRIDSLIAKGRADRIFLAADAPETYDAFLETFGERVAYLPRELYDRSAEQLRHALADALLLGSAPLLLGSTWSSFSELAMRLSSRDMKIEMSGKHF